MTDTLKAPVGEKGKYLGPLNRSEDVLLVRKLLEPHLKKLGMVYLLKKKEEEKGECDPQLIKAIRVFQEKRLKLLWSDENANIHKSPAYDGRIDPGDETFWALTHSAVDETSKRAVIKRPAKGLVLAGGKDLPGRSDATGAFLVGAKAFCALYHLSKWVPIDNTQSYEKRCQATYGAMDKAEDGTLDVIAFFGHGTPGSLPTFGFFTGDIGRLATKIKAKCKKNSAILLYACSAGAFGGFADKLATAINSGLRAEDRRMVYGHLIDGHSYQNAYCSYFPGPGYVVSPTTSLFATWQRKMMGGDLWARFPFMSDSELTEELQPKKV